MENTKIMNCWRDDVESITINSQIDCLRNIEVNLSNVCNLKCPFCPHNFKWENTHKEVFMSIDIAKQIQKHLTEFSYKGFICMAGFGEPSLNPYFKDIIKILSQFHIVIVTNGTQLTSEDWEEIQSYSNKIKIKVSIHDWSKEKFFKEKFKNVNSLFRNHDMKNPEMNLYNRAGFLKTNTILERRCNYPFYKVFIDSNGNYLQCEADWNRLSTSKHNIFNISVYDYFTKTLNETREKMFNKPFRQCFDCCKLCDIDGQMIGNPFVEWWLNDRKRFL